ncbi:MAG: oligosaccharide flippase family protein [Cetobacterium sp.]
MKLIKNTIFYILGNILVQGVNFLTLPIYSRLMTIEEIGKVSLYSTWVSIISIFICGRTFGSIGIMKNQLKNQEYKDYMSSIVLLSIFSFIFFLIPAYFINNKVIKFMNVSKIEYYFIIFQSLLTNIIMFITTLYIFEEEALKKIKISFFYVGLNIIFSLIALIFFKDKVFARIIGMFSSNLLVGIYSLVVIIKKFGLKFNKNYMKSCLLLTIPIIFHAVSNTILTNSDKIMLDKYSTVEEVGLYSFVYIVGMILNVLWASCNSAWSPWFYRKLKEKKIKEIEKVSLIYLEMFGMITGIFLLISPFIVRLVLPPTYEKGIELLPYIIGGYYFVFLYGFSINYEFYLKKTKFVASGTLLAALFNMIFNYIYIPNLGALGAALSTFLSYILLFIFHEVILRVFLNKKIINFSKFLKEIIIVLFLILGLVLDIPYFTQIKIFYVTFILFKIFKLKGEYNDFKQNIT